MATTSANGITDATGSDYAAPGRYDYYHTKMREFSNRVLEDAANKYIAAHPDKVAEMQAAIDSTTSGWGESYNPSRYGTDPVEALKDQLLERQKYTSNPNDGPATPPVDLTGWQVPDTAAMFKATLTPPQLAEMNQVEEAKYNKGTSTNRGGAAIAMAAMGGLGALAAEGAAGAGAVGSIGGELTAGLAPAQIAALGEGIAGSSAGAAGLGGAFGSLAPEAFTGAGLVGGVENLSGGSLFDSLPLDTPYTPPPIEPTFPPNGYQPTPPGGVPPIEPTFPPNGYQPTPPTVETLPPVQVSAPGVPEPTFPPDGYNPIPPVPPVEPTFPPDGYQPIPTEPPPGNGSSPSPPPVKPPGGGGNNGGNVNWPGLLAGGAGLAAILGMNNTSPLPTIPNFKSLAEQTAASNNAQVDKQTLANRPDQANAQGDTLKWVQGPDGQWTQTTQYGASNQQAFDETQSLLSQLRGTAASNNATGNNPSISIMDPVGNAQAIQDAYMKLQQPGLDQQRNALIQRLRAQGLPDNSEAMQRAMKTQGDIETDAGLKGLLAGTTEYGNQFNRSLAGNAQQFNQNRATTNDVYDNMGKAKLAGPGAPAFQQFTNAAAGKGVDYTLAGQNEYSGLLGNYNAESAMNANKMNGIASMVGGLGSGLIGTGTGTGSNLVGSGLDWLKNNIGDIFGGWNSPS